jgi:transcriptional regulator with XRE-family HTH domain
MAELPPPAYALSRLLFAAEPRAPPNNEEYDLRNNPKLKVRKRDLFVKTCRFRQRFAPLAVSGIGYRVLSELAMSSVSSKHMTSAHLSNYLRANRKRLGLSQAEVAFLLGAETGETVCRHERFAREPSLETALAYEAIYQRPTRELFAGLYQSVEQEVAARAKAFISRTHFEKPDRQSGHRRQTLTDIAARLYNKSQNGS